MRCANCGIDEKHVKIFIYHPKNKEEIEGLDSIPLCYPCEEYQKEHHERRDFFCLNCGRKMVKYSFTIKYPPNAHVCRYCLESVRPENLIFNPAHSKKAVEGFRERCLQEIINKARELAEFVDVRTASRVLVYDDTDSRKLGEFVFDKMQQVMKLEDDME